MMLAVNNNFKAGRRNDLEIAMGHWKVRKTLPHFLVLGYKALKKATSSRQPDFHLVERACRGGTEDAM